MEPVKLSEVEFWRLKSRVDDARRLTAEAGATPEAIEAKQAWKRAGAAFEELARAYGFDATLTIAFDESTFSLVPKTPAEKAPPTD